MKEVFKIIKKIVVGLFVSVFFIFAIIIEEMGIVQRP